MEAPIPTTQHAAVLQDLGDQFAVVLRNDIPVGNPGPSEILVILSCTGLCHSEVRAALGWGSYNPSKPALRYLPHCWASGSESNGSTTRHCAKQLNTSRNVPGTLQQYVLADARFITRIPEGIADEIAAPLICAGLTMAGALSHLERDLKPGDWIVISGSGGGLGHIGVQLAARVKKMRVIAVDSRDNKRDLSLASSAEVFIDFQTEDVAARVQELTSESAHATIIVPETKEAFQTAALVVRNMGHIVTVGLPRNDIELPISATVCAARGLTIRGSSVGTEEQMTELLHLALEGIIQPSISVFDFSETPMLIQGLTKDEILGRSIVRIPQDIIES